MNSHVTHIFFNKDKSMPNAFNFYQRDNRLPYACNTEISLPRNCYASSDNITHKVCCCVVHGTFIEEEVRSATFKKFNSCILAMHVFFYWPTNLKSNMCALRNKNAYLLLKERYHSV